MTSGDGQLLPRLNEKPDPEYWKDVQRIEQEDAKVFDALIQQSIDRGWGFFNHTNGNRDGITVFEKFVVSKRMKVKVIRVGTDAATRHAPSEHTYTLEQVLFASDLGFLTALCGDAARDVAHAILDLPTYHDRLSYLQDHALTQ